MSQCQGDTLHLRRWDAPWLCKCIILYAIDSPHLLLTINPKPAYNWIFVPPPLHFFRESSRQDPPLVVLLMLPVAQLAFGFFAHLFWGFCYPLNYKTGLSLFFKHLPGFWLRIFPANEGPLCTQILLGCEAGTNCKAGGALRVELIGCSMEQQLLKDWGAKNNNPAIAPSHSQ